MAPIYLDYAATTPLDARVFEAMRPFFLEDFGNAGSRTHVYGQRAKEAVDAARKQIADLLRSRPEEIVFTSGATEANNLAILGIARHGLETGRSHVLSTAIEHKAVLEPLAQLRDFGFEVELLPVTAGGYVEPDEVEGKLRADTLLVSIMHANNETGVLQPVHEISELLGDTGPYFHVDAAQTYGKEVEALQRLRCDFLAISGHKVYGPKGIGALYIRRRGSQRRPLTPLLFGGGQERALRPGTLPVPLVVGFGVAAALAMKEHMARRTTAIRVRERFLEELTAVEFQINGDPGRMQPHILNVSFPGVDSEALMMATRRHLAISNGSACTSASYEPSHVLKAMGVEEDRIASAVRLSWGLGVEEIPSAPLIDAVRALRG